MIAVTLTIRLPWWKETLALSLPDGAKAGDALAAAGIAESGEHVFAVRSACLLHPEDPLAHGDALQVLPVMLGG